MDREEIKENLAMGETWIRGLFMLFFALCYSIAEILLLFVSVFQFFSTLLTGRTQGRVLGFGKALSDYVYQIYLFLTFNSEEKPFPFSPWPDDENSTKKNGGGSKKKKAAKKKSTSKAKSEDDSESESPDDDDDEAHLGV